MNIAEHIRDIPNFPKEGIVFKDITTLLANPEAMKYVYDTWQDRYRGKVDAVIGIESRGFIFGATLADRLALPFVPVRKPGKLPYSTISREYALEYGTDSLHIHTDSLEKGQKVVVIDDLLATGGTAKATAELIEELGAEIVEMAFVIELSFIPARTTKLKGYAVHSFVEVESE
ncbi:MAG: adenine phosphoribosyltransferase [Candidatus Lindowbacteria bacterium]|nr:adenine phosphoribosyltransferase [Candidatus Lindowbacteria bacterium]